MDMNEIGVSVCCITYNQADYITEAIESFLIQETNFDFEILIHDDASTDGTSDIVRSYVEKYPEKIHAVIQEENQYSKGVKVAATFLYPISKGKYIASCEGDDYWTDVHKLQKQYDYMESHPDCSMCIHEGHIVTEDKSIEFRAIPKFPCEKILGMEDAIMGIGIDVVTNSFFTKADFQKRERPKFAQVSPVGDYITPIIMAQYGYIYYSPEKMSAHRMLAKNSFSKTMSSGKASIERWNKYLVRLENTMKLMDEYFQYEYSSMITKSLEKQKFNLYVSTENWSELRKEPYRSMLKELSGKRKLRLYFPSLFHFLQVIHYTILRKRGVS